MRDVVGYGEEAKRKGEKQDLALEQWFPVKSNYTYHNTAQYSYFHIQTWLKAVTINLSRQHCGKKQK